jgi:hypothetical protein
MSASQNAQRAAPSTFVRLSVDAMQPFLDSLVVRISASEVRGSRQPLEIVG